MRVEVRLGSILTVQKVARGQFNTTGSEWLLPQVREFIASSGCSQALDPFAGRGDLLAALREFSIPLTGYDVDRELVQECGWTLNDSLLSIPAQPNTLIVTNPPYLAKHSAKRKGVAEAVWHYYRDHTDLYQEALAECLKAVRFTVAIVPETLIGSGFPLSACRHLTVILDDLFSDTEQHVVVACFDREWSGGPEVFHGPNRVSLLSDLLQHRVHPTGRVSIRFNEVDGQIGLRAVDSQDPAKPIAFVPSDQLVYADENIKNSSRLVTRIRVKRLRKDRVQDVCDRANTLLQEARALSSDAILSPFKGSTKAGARRRRLDYDLARALLERAITEWSGQSRQGRLSL